MKTVCLETRYFTEIAFASPTPPLMNTIVINIFREILWELVCLESISQVISHTQQPFSLPCTVLDNLTTTKIQILKRTHQRCHRHGGIRWYYLDTYLYGVFILYIHSYKAPRIQDQFLIWGEFTISAKKLTSIFGRNHQHFTATKSYYKGVYPSEDLGRKDLFHLPQAF